MVKLSAYVALWLLLAFAGTSYAADVYRWGNLTGSKAIAPSSYVGPGDVVPGATAYFGLRAYNRAVAVAGSNVALIKNTSTAETCNIPLAVTGKLSGVVSGCSGASSGDTIATFCAESGGPCTVQELYDQTGNGNNVSRGQSALQPGLSLSCLNSLPCLQTVYSQAQGLASSGNVAATSPYSMIYTASRTGNDTSVSYVFCDCAGGTGDAGVGFGSVVNTGYIYAGVSGLSVAGVADNATHAVQATFIGFGSSFCHDGTCVGTSPGSNSPDDVLRIGYNGNLQNCSCNIFEAGLWPLQFTSTQISNMCANQYNYWGTAVSCTPAPPASLLLEGATDNLLLESGGSNVLCLEGAC